MKTRAKVTVEAADRPAAVFSDVKPGGLFVGIDGKQYMRSAPKGTMAICLETGEVLATECSSVSRGFSANYIIPSNWPIREVTPPGTKVVFEA